MVSKSNRSFRSNCVKFGEGGGGGGTRCIMGEVQMENIRTKFEPKVATVLI